MTIGVIGINITVKAGAKCQCTIKENCYKEETFPTSLVNRKRCYMVNLGKCIAHGGIQNCYDD
jgi:hypothetical protein